MYLSLKLLKLFKSLPLIWRLTYLSETSMLDKTMSRSIGSIPTFSRVFLYSSQSRLSPRDEIVC